jgi:hypothetical protein
VNGNEYGPNEYSSPTVWSASPLINSSQNITYDNADTEYGSTTQPYGGYAQPTSVTFWNTPTSWHNSALPGSDLVYYGGPNTVPFNAGPTQWRPNATPNNQTGVYDPLNPINNPYVNLYPYDSSSDEYDSSTREYDGTVAGESLVFFNNPTAWVRIAGGPQ